MKEDWSLFLSSFRRKFGLLQKDLASLTQTTQATISRWERGTVPCGKEQARVHLLLKTYAATKGHSGKDEEGLAFVRTPDIGMETLRSLVRIPGRLALMTSDACVVAASPEVTLLCLQQGVSPRGYEIPRRMLANGQEVNRLWLRELGLVGSELIGLDYTDIAISDPSRTVRRSYTAVEVGDRRYILMENTFIGRSNGHPLLDLKLIIKEGFNGHSPLDTERMAA